MIEQTNFQIAQKQHSRLGIVSTVIGLILPVLLVSFIVSGSILNTKKDSIGNDIAVAYILISLTFPLLHLIALILGIIGLCFKDTKKLFAIIGTILNAILLLVGIGIFFLFLSLLESATAFR